LDGIDRSVIPPWRKTKVSLALGRKKSIAEMDSRDWAAAIQMDPCLFEIKRTRPDVFPLGVCTYSRFSFSLIVYVLLGAATTNFSYLLQHAVKFSQVMPLDYMAVVV
jgi:hypothetical protein